MTAGKDAPASHELAHVAQRLASFAAGCLGTSSPAKTGSRLGVMGNVSEAELREILHHIEVLSKQRAAGLAGQSSGYPESTSQTHRPGSSFQQALKEACGVDAEELHLYLPRDAGGKVDLLQIFRMENGKATPEAAVKYVDSCDGCDALAEFVDHPSDLPKLVPPELPTLGLEVDPAQWLQDTVAINALRSAVFHKVAAEVDDRLLPISKRCRSRRPALCKTALRAMAELADADLPKNATWLAHGREMTEACLGAMQVTKVTAKLGEETLDAVCRRLQADGTTAEVLQVLCNLQCPEVKHPACVAAMLRVMGTCLGRASSANSPSDSLGPDSLEMVSEFCEEILKNRRLSPAFSEARVVQRLLAERRG